MFEMTMITFNFTWRWLRTRAHTLRFTRHYKGILQERQMILISCCFKFI